jgi:hypothetical protein
MPRTVMNLADSEDGFFGEGTEVEVAVHVVPQLRLLGGVKRRKVDVLPPQQLRRKHRLTRLFVLHVLVVPVVLHDIENVALRANVDRVLRHDLVDRAREELDVALGVALNLTDEGCAFVGFLER